MAGITNAAIAQMFDILDKKIDGVNTRLDILNGRTFKNSTDIAKMKGQTGVIAFTVSLITSLIGIYCGTRQ